MSECYCCTCGYNDFGVLVQWDPACRNHGAHGIRGCKKHGSTDQPCDCGCGYLVGAA